MSTTFTVQYIYTLNVYQTVDVGVGWEGEGGSVSKDAK